MIKIARDSTHAIVSAVLAQHAIEADEGKRDLIAQALEMAGGFDEKWLADVQQNEQDEHCARLDRIRKLDELISAYHERAGNDLRIRLFEADTFGSWDDLLINRWFGRHLLAVVNDMERLRCVESYLAKVFAPKPPPAGTPVTAKNHGAALIAQELADLQIPTRRATLIIADMLIEAGVIDRLRDRTLEANTLYQTVRNAGRLIKE